MQAVAFSQALAAVLDDTGVTFSDVVFVNATDIGSFKSTLQRRRLMQVGLSSYMLKYQRSHTYSSHTAIQQADHWYVWSQRSHQRQLFATRSLPQVWLCWQANSC